MLLLSLILGPQWKFTKLPNVEWYDPKIISSFILLIVYSMFLYFKVRKNKQGKALALFNTAVSHCTYQLLFSQPLIGISFLVYVIEGGRYEKNYRRVA